MAKKTNKVENDNTESTEKRDELVDLLKNRDLLSILRKGVDVPVTSKDALNRLEPFIDNYYEKLHGNKPTEIDKGEVGSAERFNFYMGRVKDNSDYLIQTAISQFAKDYKAIARQSKPQLKGLAKVIGSDDKLLHIAGDREEQEIFRQYAKLESLDRSLEKIRAYQEKFDSEKDATKKKEIFEEALGNIPEELQKSILLRMQRNHSDEAFKNLESTSETFRRQSANTERELFRPKSLKDFADAYEFQIVENNKNELLQKLKIKLERKKNESDSAYNLRIKDAIDEDIALRSGKVLYNEIVRSGNFETATQALDLFYAANNDFKHSTASRKYFEAFPN